MVCIHLGGERSMTFPAGYMTFLRRFAAFALAFVAFTAGAQTDEWLRQLMNSTKAREQARYDEALASAKTLLDDIGGENAPPSEPLAIVLTHLGRIHADQKRYASAHPYFVRALNVDEHRFGKESWELRDALMYLAGNHVAQSQFAPAEEAYLRLLAIGEREFGRAHVNLTLPLQALARAYHVQRRTDDAEKILERVMGLWSTPSATSFGVRFDGSPWTLQSLGALQAARGELKKAVSLHREAMKLIEAELVVSAKKWGSPGNGVLARAAECQERLALLHRALKQDAAAAAAETRAAKLKAEMSGEPFGTPESWAQGVLPLLWISP